MANENEKLELQVEASAKKADSELDGIVSTLRDLLSSVTGIKGLLDKTNGSLAKTNSLIKDISGTMFEVVNAAKKNDAGANMAKGFTKAKNSANDATKDIMKAVKAADSLGAKLGKKLMSGGILSESDLYDVRVVNEELERAALRYEALGSAAGDMQAPGFHGLDVDDLKAWSDANREAKELAELAAKSEKEFADLNAQLQSAIKNYQNLLRRRKAKISDGNGWGSNDIDRAREMSARIEDLCQRMEAYGETGRRAAATARQFVSAQPRDAGGGGSLGSIFNAATQLPVIGKGFSVVAKNAKKAHDVLTKFGSKITVLDKLRSAVNKLGKSFGMTLKFYVTFSLISDVMSSFTTVSQHAAKGNNELNKSLSGITQGYANLKAAATSALLPIVQWIGPSVASAMDAISESIHRIGMSLAALAGQETYTKMSAGVLDYADSLKEANGALASFDKLNILGGSSAAQEREYKTETIKLEDNEFYRQLKRLGGAAKDTAKGIGEVFTGALDTLGQHITGDSDFSFLESAQGAFEKLAAFVTENAPSLAKLIGNIGAVVWELGAAFADAIIDVVGFFAGFLPGDSASEKLKKVADWLEGVATWLKENRELTSGLIKAWMGFSLIGKILNSGPVAALKVLLNLLGKLGSTLSSAFTSSKLGLYLQDANAAGGLGPKLIGDLSPYVAKAQTALASVGATVKGFASTAGAHLTAGFTKGVTAVQGFGATTVSVMGQSVASAGALTVGIAGVIAAVAGLGTGFLAFYKAFGKGLDDVKSDLNVWKNATAEDFLYVFDLIGTKVLNVFQNAVNAIRNLFSNLWSSITSKISSLGTKISSAFSGARVSTGRTGGRVRSYAAGGIINRGQLFRANEKGPELVGTLDGKSAVANQAQVYNAMYDGIYRAMLRAMNMSGGAGGGDIYLTAELDGEKVYTSVVKRNKSKTKQTGKNPLLAY